MKLTDAVIKAKTRALHALAKDTGKPQKLADGAGLYLLFTPAGGRSWNAKYRISGKEKRSTYGQYPTITLAQARERHQEARKLLAEGIDPGERRKADKRAAKMAAANSFEAVAKEWLAEYGPTVTGSTYDHAKAWMENDVFPWLGRRPLAEIDAPEILDVLKRIDGRGARHTAHKVRSKISLVFRYGIRHGYCRSDPARDLIGAIPQPKTTHFASITDPAKVGEMLRAFEGFSGTFAVQCALKLAPVLFVRPGELRTAEWAHIDLDKAEWRYRVSKTGTDHLVPLATQAVSILRELHALTGHGRYVFPGARSHERPMSEAAINAALRRLGYDTRTEITGHGFRAMARTILHEELGQKPEVIEHQLAHAVPDMLGAAYNRTKFIKERRAMMQIWADYLDSIKVGGHVIPLARAS
ncbi:Tyr recombinase domain-containing protein [Bordetella tumbae]|uniref:tyrosine-type recombinase/integrase n=1 Tax=Bordetella tumbae TaxID=1649139 RepID=UPI0039EF467F